MEENKKYLYDGFIKISEIEHKEKKYEKLHLKDSVAALIINQDNEILLVKQYRPCYGIDTLELVAGVIDNDDLNEEETIIKEIFEESNISKEQISSIINYETFIHSIGTGNSCTTIFLIDVQTNFSKVFITNDDVTYAKFYNIDEIKQMLVDETIMDAKTKIALYKYIGRDELPNGGLFNDF